MASNDTMFTHTPLPSDEHHIRLLQFEDKSTDGYLRFSLRPYKFSDQIVYNALSYEWGNTTADKTIFVNDCPFLIRSNLYNFLEILASNDQGNMLFFTDAICINQEDILERNSQVRQISNLYRQAEKVLVWLGAGTAESDLIFDICANNEQETIDLQGSSGDALDILYRRSYWTRLWIIQELFLARDIVLFCGLKSASWPSFRQLTTSVKGNIVEGGSTGADIELGSSRAGLHTRDVLGELDHRGHEDSIESQRP